MLKFEPSWVEPQIGKGDTAFDLYPQEPVEKWHKARRLWVE